MKGVRPHGFLLPLSWGYAAGVCLRNAAYDRGIFRMEDVGVPVVAVGNLTAGGTGKTPLAAELANRLVRRGLKPAIVSRGYGRRTTGVVIVSDGKRVLADAAEGGDETVMLARRLPGTVVVAAERRTDAARVAVKAFGATAVIMDDGFQHRALQRDLNILVVNGRIDLARERMLPAGLRREPLRSMGRAGLLVVTGMESEEAAVQVAGRLKRWYAGPVIAAKTVVNAVVAAEDGSSRSMPGEVAMFSGIGNPDAFRETMNSQRCTIVREWRFGDHYAYVVEDLERMAREARDAGAGAMVTTEKDAVRIAALNGGVAAVQRHLPLLVVRISSMLLDAGGRMEEALNRLLKRSP